MCIYLGDDVDSSIKSEDHIFPACVGGVNKLSNQAVCAEANRILSSLESSFSHESMISMLREFHGPGKRGKIKIPEGAIRVMYNEQNQEYNLGYLFEGKPNLIPQIVFENGKKSFHFVCDSNLVSEPQLYFNELVQKIHKKLIINNKFSYVKIDDTINKEVFIVGLHKDKIFIATANTRESIDLNLISEYFSACMCANVSKPERKIIPNPIVHDQIIETEKTNRIYAKTVFNSLCYLKGVEFVNHPNFDLFRKWIITGEGHSSGWINEDIVETPNLKNIFPDFSHWCIFTVFENQVVAIISFYGYSTRKFIIGKLPPSTHFSLSGLVCDWKNKNEITLDEYFKEVAYSNHELLTKTI